MQSFLRSNDEDQLIGKVIWPYVLNARSSWYISWSNVGETLYFQIPSSVALVIHGQNPHLRFTCFSQVVCTHTYIYIYTHAHTIVYHILLLS
jgi:hypothetical protein